MHFYLRPAHTQTALVYWIHSDVCCPNYWTSACSSLRMQFCSFLETLIVPRFKSFPKAVIWLFDFLRDRRLFCWKSLKYSSNAALSRETQGVFTCCDTLTHPGLWWQLELLYYALGFIFFLVYTAAWASVQTYSRQSAYGSYPTPELTKWNLARYPSRGGLSTMDAASSLDYRPLSSVCHIGSTRQCPARPSWILISRFQYNTPLQFLSFSIDFFASCLGHSVHDLIWTHTPIVLHAN